MDRISICIVGLGPWGLCVLERVISRARRQPAPHTSIMVHVIEPGDPGVGVHARNLPDYNLLNTKCSHVSMFIEDHFPDIPSPETGPNLLEWAHAQGYRLEEDGYTLTRSHGRDISPEDFLPRRLMGEYLSWFYQRMLEDIPPNVRYTLHPHHAVNVERDASGGEIVVLDNDERIKADHVFLTTGHTRNSSQSARMEAGHLPVDYPVDKFLTRAKAGSYVGLAGFGLVAMDVLAALTLGRGGQYRIDPDTGRRLYIPSGNEPHIYMFSRSGLPYCPRPAISKTPSMGYTPVLFTPQRIDEIRASKIAKGADGRIDFFTEAAPLLWDEMTLAYYAWSARLAHGESVGETVTVALEEAWQRGAFAQRISEFAQEYGEFYPRDDVLKEWPNVMENSADYQRQICALIEDDLIEAKKGEIQSARKAALELLRVLRNTIRYVVDFGGLTEDSQIAFTTRFATQINRMIVGPPKERSEEMLALVEAGILRIPFGPAPRILQDNDTGKLMVSSTRLKEPYRTTLDMVCHAYTDQPTVHRSVSPLLNNLYRTGRLQTFRCGDHDFGSALVDEQLHPINRSGQTEERLWMLGPLTEGVKYYNYYIPSPTSRFRAFREADDCVRSILACSVTLFENSEIC
jgi:hypothetical protein